MPPPTPLLMLSTGCPNPPPPKKKQKQKKNIVIVFDLRGIFFVNKTKLLFQLKPLSTETFSLGIDFRNGVCHLYPHN